jgi:hypothetical protein
MNYSNINRILLFCVAILALSAEASDDTTSSGKSSREINPATVIISSGIIPGSGQLLNRRFLKAGTFIALEAFTVSSAVFWNSNAQSRVEEYHKILSSITPKDSSFVRAEKLEEAHGKKFQTLEAEYKRYNALTWAGGIYLYNLFDAFDLTGLYKDNGKRNPGLAFGLAAIPGLGLGQIYNGSYSKAGLFIMTQVSLGMLAYNNHRLMRIAEQNFTRISDTTMTLPLIKSEYTPDWDGRRQTAMRNRNMFLWYSIFNYVIGMLDAVVDAHLHDYNEKMKIEPDLVPSESGTGLNLKLSF